MVSAKKKMSRKDTENAHLYRSSGEKESETDNSNAISNIFLH